MQCFSVTAVVSAWIGFPSFPRSQVCRCFASFSFFVFCTSDVNPVSTALDVLLLLSHVLHNLRLLSLTGANACHFTKINSLIDLLLYVAVAVFVLLRYRRRLS